MNAKSLTDQMKILGARIEKYRLLKDVTQADLAEDAGVGERTLRRLESGEGGTIETMMRVTGALGISDSFADLIPDHDVRPIERARQSKTERARATGTSGKQHPPTRHPDTRGDHGNRQPPNRDKTPPPPNWGDGKK